MPDRRWMIAPLLLLATPPGALHAQEAELDSVPDDTFFVTNLMRRSFTCTVNNSADGALRSFALAGGGQYNRSALRDPVVMTCDGHAFQLQAGRRYALVAAGNDFTIRDVTP